MSYLIQTKTGVKGPFTKEQIQAFVDQGQLKTEHQLTDEKSGQQCSVASVIAAQSHIDENPFSDTEPEQPAEQEKATARTTRRTRSKTGRGSSTKRHSRNRQSGNAFAPPEADSGYDSGRAYGDDAGADLVYRCVNPINKAVPWIRVLAVIILVFSLLGIIQVFMGNWLALIMLVPIWISLLLLGCAKNIRGGMRQQKPKLIRKGMDNLATAIRIWTIVLLVYIAVAVVMVVYMVNTIRSM